MPRLKAGDSVDGRYVIEDVIGRGGMGCVYRAHDLRLHRRVALKVLLAEAEEPDDAPGARNRTTGNAGARMLREARAAASFDHPNAAQVFDVGEVNGSPYIAMELIVGKTLSAFVGAVDITWATRLRWLLDAARALGAAHRVGLIHRDVKPDNVMVRNDGIVKVLDFGIVRLADPLNPMGATIPSGFPSLTEKGAVLGTPLYMAPEQIRGLSLDARADQFSWGVMAFELLAGQMPWGTGLEAIGLALSTPPAPLKGACPELPDAVEGAILRALEKVPSDRFASMDDLASAIESFAAAPVTAGAPSGPSVVPIAPRDPTTESMRAIPLITPKRTGDQKGLALGAVLAIGFAGFLTTQAILAPAPVAHAVLTTPSAESTTRSVAITDLPRPATTRPDALAAYLAGMQALRDASTEVAMADFERAVSLDPAMAAAHLRIGIFQSVAESASARQAFEKAEDLRGVLSEHDQVLMDAMEPTIRRQPADWAEGRRRLLAAIEKFPNDAELRFHLGGVCVMIDPTTAVPVLASALALDPKFAFAWSWKAESLAYAGDFDGAMSDVNACLAASSSAAACLLLRGRIDQARGDRQAAEVDARRLTTTNTEAPNGYFKLAQALLAQGRPTEAAREVLKLSWARIANEAERRRTQLRHEIALDQWTGDFAQAEQDAHALEQAVDTSLAEDDHAFAARALVETYAETGRVAQAGKVAVAFFKRQEAWVPDPDVDDWAIAADPTPVLLEAELRAGLLSKAELDAKRAAWLTRWKAATSPFYARYLWVHGVAGIARTPAEATDALAALASSGVIPPFRPYMQSDASLGRVYLQAGQVDTALPFLKIAASGCLGLSFPVETTRAYLSLGLALEAKGDVAGACAAYAGVLERWGKSTPKSITAEASAVRSTALHCSKTRLE